MYVPHSLQWVYGQEVGGIYALRDGRITLSPNPARNPLRHFQEWHFQYPEHSPKKIQQYFPAH